MLLLSCLGGSILVGMENEYFSVKIMQKHQITQPNGSVLTLYPILIIDKKRNTPRGFHDFDRPVRTIRLDAARKYIADVELSDGTISRLDLRP